MTSTEQCPSCQSAEATPYWPGAGQGGYTLRQCRECRLVFTWPWPTDEQLAQAYSREYYGAASQRFWPALERFVRQFRLRRARRLSRWVSPGRALDIGCGRGWTLAALRELGWQVQGVELNADAARHAQEVLKLDVSLGGFEPLHHEPESFDAVVLWHVLEHLRDPVATLSGIARLLKPGGVLALAVPNRASWQARLTHYAWFHVDLPRHLWHFSPDDLRGLCDRHGLRVARVNHVSWEQNPYGWIQSLLNLSGLKHNLLYDLIRRESARGEKSPWQSHPVQSVVSALGGAALLPAAVAMLLPEWLLGVGATVDIYAVKQ